MTPMMDLEPLSSRTRFMDTVILNALLSSTETMEGGKRIFTVLKSRTPCSSMRLDYSMGAFRGSLEDVTEEMDALSSSSS